MKHLARNPLSALAVAGLAFLAGCSIGSPAQDDPTRYYVLSDSSAPASNPAPGGLRIGIHIPSLGSYLKKREMVVRNGANEIKFEDYRRWAETLESGIPRLVRGRLLASDKVASAAIEPFPIDQERDYDVAIEVRHCEGATAGDGREVARFSATIEIMTAGANPTLVARKVFVAPDAPWDGNFEHLASLLSADITALGGEILADLPPKK